MLVAVYGVFAISASARSGVQIAQSYSAAPVAYTLSAVAAVVYLVATVSLAIDAGWARRTAWLAVGLELVGVAAVGALTVTDQDVFPDETVWSAFGAGYGYVPLVLPVLGLLWLSRTRHQGTGRGAAASQT
jgi:hypothetical protein